MLTCAGGGGGGCRLPPPQRPRPARPSESSLSFSGGAPMSSPGSGEFDQDRSWSALKNPNLTIALQGRPGTGLRRLCHASNSPLLVASKQRVPSLARDPLSWFRFSVATLEKMRVQVGHRHRFRVRFTVCQPESVARE
jgi:hypothetical protein